MANTMTRKVSGLLTVTKKILMALTGVFLIIFLLVHLSGNFTLLAGKEAFNTYSEFMKTNFFIRIMEVFLVLGFAVHIYTGLKLAMENRRARPVRYKMYKSQADFFSRFMPVTGIVIFIFLFTHIYNFVYPLRLGGENDAYELVRTTLSNPVFSVIYIVSFVLLGFHLAHGFRSAFQTLGIIINKKVDKVLRSLAYLYAVLVPGGFIFIALYFLING